MTDVPGHEPAPTDAEIEEVRALLGEARVTDPVPAHVAARLDDALAGLAAERAQAAAADGTPADVVPLRRRWAPRVLVAAAAVVVLGGTAYGVGRIAGSGDGGSASTASSARSTTQSTTQATAPSGSAASSGQAASGSATKAPAPLPGAVAVTSLRSRHFAADARRALPALTGAFAAQDRSGQPDSLTSSQAATACPGPTRAGVQSAPARLDGRLVALLVQAPHAGTRLVQAWSCDGRTLLASAHVPAG